jgi:uncharacterized protein (TIGR00369 family)
MMADDTNTRYGVADPQAIAGLSGREFLQGWIDGKIPAPPIGATMSMRLVEVGDGFVAFEGDPGAHLLNPMGGIHGGWALTLIDSAGACAANSVLPPQTSVTTLETKGNFCRPITTATGTVRAEGRIVSQTRQIISTEIRITSAEGKVLAHGTSTLMILSRQG